ncbi:MAG: YdcH family protein [Alphaproteobacteria bacterium]|jgi:hypothetical protein|nr:YdcH family protein [Pseudomonadota bacterium]MCH8137604.1 YdcH family protein [Pseudomonadota bacterium]MCZ6481988.1 YdcH family protein [Alphaproteobacteria bacterium]MCZ6745546.1 YdcH family protein [Alphaproteobacteria bacterium]TDI58483.1 MAG: DUF465 domain-containing protein [Alphaproteobacteria bacterium]
MNEKEALFKQLEELRGQHRELDEVIARLSEEAASNPIELQRLKKRKLMLKDQITAIKDELLPDIIA